MTGDPFRAHRERSPVHWHAPSRAWLITRHADVARLLVDPRLTSRTLGDHVDRLPGLAPDDRSALAAFFGDWLSLTDGDRHRELRRAIAPVLAPARVAPLLPPLRAAALRHAREADRDDVEHTFARPYAGSVIALALGLTDAETARTLSLTADLVRVLRPGAVTAPQALAAAAALREVTALVDDVSARPPVRPEAPPLMAGCGLPAALRVATFVQLVGGGHDPLARCLTSYLDATAGLLDATGGEDLLDALVRRHGPFELLPRIATEPLTVGGRDVEAGSRVMLAIGSADHDADAPAGAGPLAFGGGRHRCPASGLARAALGAAVEAFVRPPEEHPPRRGAPCRTC